MKTIDLRDLEHVLGGTLDSKPARLLPQERPLPLPGPLPGPPSTMPLGPFYPTPPSNVV
jgi:hypothetical protein